MTQSRQNKPIPQIVKANKVLQTLAVNVTAEDRAAAIQELGFNRMTITFYLQGKAKDLDMATKLIRFFKIRIKERDKELTH